MKVIHEAHVNGITLYFNKIGVVLDASHSLDDPTILGVYQFGQRLHPIILYLHKNQGIYGYMDTIEADLEAFPPNWRDAAKSITERASRKMFDACYNATGYVYLIRHQDRPGLYKIGKSSKPNDRMKAFRLKLPFDVEFEVLIETDDMDRVEKEWHERFKHKRVDGEWFMLDESDVEWMRQDDYRRRQAQKETTLPDEIETWEKQHGIQ